MSRRRSRYGKIGLRKPKDPSTETLERLQRWPGLRKRFEGRSVRLYSRQWGAYWGPNGSGYYDIEGAGEYTFEDAWRRSSHAGPEKGIEYRLIL